jgi:hypothetical protein
MSSSDDELFGDFDDSGNESPPEPEDEEDDDDFGEADRFYNIRFFKKNLESILRSRVTTPAL